MPKPPIWISARTTPSPNGVQWLPVPTMERPPLSAPAEVNKAVSTLVPRPGAVAAGSVSRAVPSTTTKAKPHTTPRVG